ncbi:MAG: carbohydrate-binding protein [Pseudomonadota bacterium]
MKPAPKGPADLAVAGNVIRAAEGQVVAFSADITEEVITFYDAFQAGLEAELPTVDLGEADEDGAISKLYSNPLTSANEPTAFASADDPAVAWEPGQKMIPGKIYEHEGDKWIARQAHSSQSDWKPKDVPALFSKIPANKKVWDFPVKYAVGDEVYFPDGKGALYRCRQAHTSIAPWTPVAVPALWETVKQ